MWLIARAFVGWGKGKKETDHKAGDIVIHENKYYKAEKDIPGCRGRAGQGTRDGFALRRRRDSIPTRSRVCPGAAWQRCAARRSGKEQLLIFGPELAQCVGRELNQAEANNIYSGMRDSLKSVVQRMAQAWTA